MKIKCPKCNSQPTIDILDKIQSIRFICQNKTNYHYGLFSINNFYKTFITNYQEEFNNFIEKSKINYDKNNIVCSSATFEFIKFQNDFELLLKELTNEYLKFKNYFYKILFIKDIVEINKGEQNEYLKDNRYYYNSHIIKGMKKIINSIKNSILIKEEYPKILTNDEITHILNEELISINNRNLFCLDNIKKDFEYFNFGKNNCSIKKIIKFELNNEELNTVRDRKLLKLNKALEPACFLYSYTERNKGICNSFIKVYDKYLNLLFSNFICSKRIHEIIQLNDNSLLLILFKKIMIINLDINNKMIILKQEIEKKTKFFFETLLDDDKISLLIPINTKKHFYLKNNINNDIYSEKKVIISFSVPSDNTYFINNYNFIILKSKQIFFYKIQCNYNSNKNNYDIEIIRGETITTKDYLCNGIHFINKNDFIISGLNSLFLISFPYKEIISIFSYFSIERIYNGFFKECYLCLSNSISKHKIIRQICFNKDKQKGEIIIEGHTFLEELDFYNKYSFIDLGDIICYIKINQKEEDEIEYGSQYTNE